MMIFAHPPESLGSADSQVVQPHLPRLSGPYRLADGASVPGVVEKLPADALEADGRELPLNILGRPPVPQPVAAGLHHPRKDVASVLEQLGVIIERHVRRRAVGTFTLPGLLKIKVVHKPARKARKMISPFSGQEITVAAKPASRAVKVQPLSGLKRMMK